jgi:SMC interacting uncharacterized protein involved in chromosome segregation
VELQRRYVEKDRQLATHRRVQALLQRECAEVEQAQAEVLQRSRSALRTLVEDQRSWIKQYEHVQAQVEELAADADMHVQELQAQVRSGQASAERLRTMRVTLRSARQPLETLMAQLRHHKDTMLDLQCERRQGLEQRHSLVFGCAQSESELMQQFEQAQQLAREAGYASHVTKL